MNINEYVSTSHALQDAFVLDVCGENGRWLEIGASSPDAHGNNTALLELKGWTGVSIELDNKYKNLWNKSWRNSDVLIIADATKFDYASLENKHFDYVQLDVEPPSITYTCLEKILKDGITCKCLTFEHDLYSNPKQNVKYKNMAFDLLTQYGYKRIIEGVRNINLPYVDFEDWYVANSVDFPETDFYLWAKTAYGKYCKQSRSLVIK